MFDDVTEAGLTALVPSTSADPPSAGAASATPVQRAIAEHAQALFHERGFAGTSIRDVATAAGVDPAIVMRHFHSKVELFARVIGFDAHFRPQLDGPVEDLGERLVGYLLAPDHTRMRQTFTVLLRATDHQGVREELARTMSVLLVERLGDRLDGPDAGARAWLVSAQLMGLVQTWDLIAGTPAARTSRSRLVRLYGAAVQQLITPAG